MPTNEEIERALRSEVVREELNRIAAKPNQRYRSPDEVLRELDESRDVDHDPDVSSS